MEMQKVPEAGYPIEGLWISGIQRKLTLDNLSFPLKVISSLRKSRSIIKRFKPDVAIGVGGYASGPMLYAATMMGVPALVQEQNSYAGLTNKWLAGRVQKICVAYPGMESFFPKEKLVLTGNPVRKDILDSNAEEKRNKARAFFNLASDKKTLLVIGGSLGARTINDSMLGQVERLQQEGLQVIWQVGKAYYKNVTEALENIKKGDIRVFEFLREMDLAYAAADLVVSRAGALSISELCLVKKPVIFVPSPNVAEDHQTKNAMALVDHQAAIMVKDQDARKVLGDEILALVKDENKQQELAKNIAVLGRPNASIDIANEVYKLINT
jgi:UDP-N-acetylglucosamine--N-acetylmuramyl-(pentapeptide) pyrophosphoryl-undecaprenol N-acetylglucosamine transferase